MSDSKMSPDDKAKLAELRIASTLSKSQAQDLCFWEIDEANETRDKTVGEAMKRYQATLYDLEAKTKGVTKIGKKGTANPRRRTG